MEFAHGILLHQNFLYRCVHAAIVNTKWFEKWETVQAALISREADLAEEKLELQKMKDELVAGSSRGGEAMDLDPGTEDEAKLAARELELLRTFARDTPAKMGEGINVLVELSKIQRSLEERTAKKQ